eukprot:Nitzschia sp. Nitz4//scaffold234_size30613//21298//23176//NITZ4_007965-RA/size30613-augustus-gene-0.26-mRNA-1//1//CDS//3329543422//4355//frame0
MVTSQEQSLRHPSAPGSAATASNYGATGSSQGSSPLQSRLVTPSSNPVSNQTYRLVQGLPEARRPNARGFLSVFKPPPPARPAQPRDVPDDSDLGGNQHMEDLIDDEEDWMLDAKSRLLDKAQNFDIMYNAERGFRATELKFCSFHRPHMRAMHASWICFFASGFVQFAMAPLLPQLQDSLHLSKEDIWWTNVWMAIGGVPMRFMLGPLCDTYGPRAIMVAIVAMCAIPCALSGVVVVNLASLLIVRFLMGAMDAFVPCQCWITSHFVREVGGTIMAIAGGLGASGAGFTQLVVGSLFALCQQWTGGDLDLAWKLALLFPAGFALLVALWAFFFTDDCPLGNFVEVKKAGLMMERSAVDSFRSGVYNLNSWLLFFQFAGCCGVDVTMCNGCAIYFHQQFHQNIQSAGAIAFTYGFAAIYARGLGGYISDRLGDRFHLYGRLWIHFAFMLAQGGLNIWFARTIDLGRSIVIMVIFSIVVQMSMGTCYGIVPYVDSANTGSVAGVVGAGGNVGAALLGLFFINFEYDTAMAYMGWFSITMGLLTPMIVIKGYRGILFGQDDHDDPSRKQHSPLLVPTNRSPHLVKIRRQRRSNTKPNHP